MTESAKYTNNTITRYKYPKRMSWSQHILFLWIPAILVLQSSIQVLTCYSLMGSSVKVQKLYQYNKVPYQCNVHQYDNVHNDRSVTLSLFRDETTDQTVSSSSSPLSNGTTFANLVIRMEKKEQAAMKASGSKGLPIEDQVLALDPIPGQQHSTSTSTASSSSSTRATGNNSNNSNNGGYIEANKGKWNEITASRDSSTKSSSSSSSHFMSTAFRPMDIETAKELDEAVSFLNVDGSTTVATRDTLVENLIIVPLNSLYTSTSTSIPTKSSLSQKQQQQGLQRSGTSKSASSNLFRKVQRQRSFVRSFLASKLRNPFKRTETQQQQTQNQKNIEQQQGNQYQHPDYYIDRINRDRRQLAVSIAASIDTVDQWIIFCRERGGVYPILETIREGARVIRNRSSSAGSTTVQQQQQYNDPNSMKNDIINDDIRTILYNNKEYQEETFVAASTACRTIRDLCAISPELAAVITDSILRANASWNGTLMNDLRTILQYASDYTSESSKSTTGRTVDTSNPEFDSIDTSSSNNSNRGTIFMNNKRRHYKREARVRCKLYVTQLLLTLTVASDDAVTAIRQTFGLKDMIIRCSSFALKEQTRRWVRYPLEFIKWIYKLKTIHNKKATTTRHNKQNRTDKSSTKKNSNNSNKVEDNSETTHETVRRPFMEANNNVGNDLNGSVQRSANQLLAAIGHNQWIPKTPNQRGLRVLSLDGGGSRGISAISTVSFIMDKVGKGADVSDLFDIIVGTSTGAIISFLVGLKRESSARALTRYQQLISKIFVKSALSTPLMLFTTATYDESHFMNILSNILEEKNMLDTRADPCVPLVCCLTSKMSSTPTHVALFRNYNYGEGELADPFAINPDQARDDLNLPLDIEHEIIKKGQYIRKVASKGSPGVRTTSSGSRHPGSFRVLQRYALRASTAAPTVFKPVMMGGEMYCDGGIVASNPTAVAIHEARAVFPNVPIELVLSVGTGNFLEEKSAPRIGWDGIIGQIVNSATDAEQIHHILEDVFGTPSLLNAKTDKASAVSSLQYFRFNPTIGRPDEFPIDVTDPEKLMKLRQVTKDYLNEPQQSKMIDQIDVLFNGRKSWFNRFLLEN